MIYIDKGNLVTVQILITLCVCLQINGSKIRAKMCAQFFYKKYLPLKRNRRARIDLISRDSHFFLKL